jgi:MFS superfamily sulfate permease-like transporter
LKRHSDLNKDLKAVGTGSAVGGALGGIPIIAEIVRSSANVSNGAVTPWSNFFHGFFILLGTLLIPGLINQIPLAALAGILVMVGFRLASPKEFAHAYEIGFEQLIIFTVTVVAVLATDLLSGIGAGIAVKVVINIWLGAKAKNIFASNFVTEKVQEETLMVKLSGSYTFTNLIGFKQKLEKAAAENKKMVFDWSEVSFFDHTSFDKFKAWEMRYVEQGGVCEHIHNEHLKPLSKYKTSARVSKKKG